MNFETDSQGIRFPLTRTKFSAKLKAKGIICKTGTIEGQSNSVRCYFGIKLETERGLDGEVTAY